MLDVSPQLVELDFLLQRHDQIPYLCNTQLFVYVQEVVFLPT